MVDENKLDVRLMIGSLSAAAVLTGFISYVSIQLNDITVNQRIAEKQQINIDEIEDDINNLKRSSANNKIQTAHLKEIMRGIHFGGNSE